MQDLPIFEKLVASEAMIRGMDVLKNHGFMRGDAFYDVSNADAGDNRQDIVNKLYDNLLAIYNYQFQDSSQHHKTKAEEVDEETLKKIYCHTDDILPADKNTLREYLDYFVAQIYDEQGNLKQGADMRAAIKTLFQEITQGTGDPDDKPIPLNHVGMAVGTLLVELSRGQKWQQSGKIPLDGLNFTRGHANGDLEGRIRHAFDPNNHAPETSAFINPPESYETIAGLRFPSQKVGWQTHLITPSGHLVNLDSALRTRLEEHIQSGRPMEAFTVQVSDDGPLLKDHVMLVRPEDKEHDVRSRAKKRLEELSVAPVLDGARVRDEQDKPLPMPLVSIDVDLLTGLRMTPLHGQGQSELQQVKSFLKVQKIEKWVDLLPDVTGRMNDIIDKARGSQDAQVLVPLLEHTRDKLVQTLPLVQKASDKLFEGKVPPAERPRMYLTQGGMGSGKSSVTKIAKEECGNSLVISSLDDSRPDTDQIWLYMGTQNHNHDYQSLSEFAVSVRDLTTKHALEGGYNVLIDGTGIPYEGRNDAITKEFKQRGYHTSVIGTHIPLYIYDPENRKLMAESGSHRAPDDAFRRIGARQDSHLRAVPVDIIIEKHVGFPIASRNAARDRNVDRFMIQDTYGDVPHTLSFVIPNVKKETLETIAKLEGEDLISAIRERELVPKGVILPSEDDSHRHADLKVIRDNKDGSYRVEIITDMQRYVNMVQTGLLNPNPRGGPESLYDNTLTCDIGGYFIDDKKPGVLKHEPIRDSLIKTFPGHPPVPPMKVVGHFTNGLAHQTETGAGHSVP